MWSSLDLLCRRRKQATNKQRVVFDLVQAKALSARTGVSMWCTSRNRSRFRWSSSPSSPPGPWVHQHAGTERGRSSTGWKQYVLVNNGARDSIWKEVIMKEYCTQSARNSYKRCKLWDLSDSCSCAFELLHTGRVFSVWLALGINALSLAVQNPEELVSCQLWFDR